MFGIGTEPEILQARYMELAIGCARYSQDRPNESQGANLESSQNERKQFWRDSNFFKLNQRTITDRRMNAYRVESNTGMQPIPISGYGSDGDVKTGLFGNELFEISLAIGYER